MHLHEMLRSSLMAYHIAFSLESADLKLSQTPTRPRKPCSPCPRLTIPRSFASPFTPEGPCTPEAESSPVPKRHRPSLRTLSAQAAARLQLEGHGAQRFRALSFLPSLGSVKAALVFFKKVVLPRTHLDCIAVHVRQKKTSHMKDRARSTPSSRIDSISVSGVAYLA